MMSVVDEANGIIDKALDDLDKLVREADPNSCEYHIMLRMYRDLKGVGE